METKILDNNITILAVPHDGLLLLSEEEGARILEQVRSKPTKTMEERKLLAKKVKAIYGKPGKYE